MWNKDHIVIVLSRATSHHQLQIIQYSGSKHNSGHTWYPDTCSLATPKIIIWTWLFSCIFSFKISSISNFQPDLTCDRSCSKVLCDSRRRFSRLVCRNRVNYAIFIGTEDLPSLPVFKIYSRTPI